MDVISPSTALQIAGRAGRFASQFSEGEVTTFKSMDLPLLKRLLATAVETVQQAGLHPTAEQIELFAYHLPKASLSDLIDIFVTLSQLDNDKYFMCNIDDFKFLADMIQHATSCSFSCNQPLTLEWLCRQLGWPLQPPQTISDLVHLEGVFDVLDLYLWLGYRFMDMFPDMNHIRDMQQELDEIIQGGVYNITRLLRNAETPISSGVLDSEDDFEIQSRTQRAPQKLPTSGAVSALENEDFKASSTALKPATHKPSLSAQFLSAKLKNQAGRESVQLPFIKSFKLKPGQRLSDQLVKQGLLSKELMEKLLDELVTEHDKKSDDDE